MVVSLFITSLTLMFILFRVGGYTTSNWELWIIILMLATISQEVMENLP